MEKRRVLRLLDGNRRWDDLAAGDSRLLEEHLHMSAPDVILFDFADNDWHITLKGAIQLANTYPNSDLICIHWGCVDAPDMTPFNGKSTKYS